MAKYRSYSVFMFRSLTVSAPTSEITWSVSIESICRGEKVYGGIQAKCIQCPILKKVRHCRQILLNTPYMKFHENLSGGRAGPLHVDRREDVRYEAQESLFDSTSHKRRKRRYKLGYTFKMIYSET